MPEFVAYQQLLTDAVAQDGIEHGFFHAAKYAYTVLQNRGIEELTDAVVGKYVTNVILMGLPRIRGALVVNSSTDDWEGLSGSHFIFG